MGRAISILLISLGLGLLCSCGRVTDPAFQPYVDRFESESGVSAVNTIIQFGDPGSAPGAPRAGLCIPGGTIIISKEAWDERSEPARELIIYHELGHCVLSRKHTEAQDRLGAPLSIMFPNEINPKIYAERRAAYIAELFSKK